MEEETKKKLARIAMMLCAAAGVLSLVIFIPQVREMIIGLGERYVGRPLTHEVWHGRFIKWEIYFLLILILPVIIICTLAHQLRFASGKIPLFDRLQFIGIMKAKIQSFFRDRLQNCIVIPDLKKWLGFSAIVFLVAHGYCFFNALYNHDSLLIFQNNDNIMVSLGRFLRPIYSSLFRGRIAAPWLIGCLSFAFLMASAYLLLNLLNIRNLKDMCAATAMLMTATSLTLLNATYIYDSDAYMLALLLSVVGACIAIKHGRYFVISVVCMVLSMGLYQSYIQVAVLLLMFDIFADVLRNKGVKDIVRKSAVYLCSIIAAFVVYWCMVKLFQCIYQVRMTGNIYNDMSKVGQYKGALHLLSCFVGTYKYVLRSLINPITVHKTYVLVARIMLILTGMWAIVRILINSRPSKANILFSVILICLFPFGFNFVYFITQGAVHELMTFSFAVVPLLVFPLLSANETDGGKLLKTTKVTVYVSFTVIAFCNIIFANQAYVKKDLEAKSTLSVVTRIIDRIEQTEGYVAGETEVCIIGSLRENPLVVARRAGFNYDGNGNRAWVVAIYNIEHYISYYLAYPYKVYFGECPSDIADSLDMFPAKNCTAIRDGVLYIKIGGPVFAAFGQK